MSLNWEFDDSTPALATRHEEGGLWQTYRDAIIWATLAVDLGELTEANHQTFAMRLRLFDIACGGCGETELTPEVLRQFVGLKVNVKTLSDAHWFARLRKIAAKTTENKARVEVTS